MPLPFEQINYKLFGLCLYTFYESWLYSTNHKYKGTLYLLFTIGASLLESSIIDYSAPSVDLAFFPFILFAKQQSFVKDTVEKLLLNILKHKYLIMFLLTLLTMVSTLLGFPLLPLTFGGICPYIPRQEMILLLEYWNSFLGVFIPILIIFAIILLYIIRNVFITLGKLKYFVFPLIGMTIFFFYFPIIMFFFSIISSLMIMSLIYSTFISRWIYKAFSSINILNLIEDTGLLTFFFKLYIFVFSRNKVDYWIILLSTNLLTLFYSIFGRYYIFLTFVLILPLSLYFKVILSLIIFICLSMLLFRTIINLSIIISEIANQNELPAWHNFILMEGYDLPEISFGRAEGETNVQPNPRPRVNLPVNRPNNPPTIDPKRYLMILRNVNYWKVGQFAIGLCTLGAACYAGYQTSLAVDETRAANQKAEEANQIAKELNQKAEEANRLKRFEMAIQNPNMAEIIFNGRNHEFDTFRKTQVSNLPTTTPAPTKYTPGHLEYANTSWWTLRKK